MGNASGLDKKVWNEFYNKWDAALIESETALAKAKHTTIEQLNSIDLSDLNTEGLDKQRLVKTKVNQCIFRKMMLATYNNKCCITDISNPELLIAAHIAPWAEDKHNRLNPSNGLLLNALYDKAFENGLLRSRRITRSGFPHDCWLTAKKAKWKYLSASSKTLSQSTTNPSACRKSSCRRRIF